MRCSTEGQARKGYSTIDSQKELISQYVALKGAASETPWELRRFYADEGFSGKNTDRPALTELLADIKAGKVDKVVVYKVDRISRSIADFFTRDELFVEHGTTLVSVKEDWDTSTPIGRLIRNVLLSFAQMEREVISERTRDKMYEEAKRGLWTGGVVPFGYRVEGKRMIPEPAEAAVVRFMFEKYAEVRSVARVRDAVNAKGYVTGVRRYKDGHRGGGTWSIQRIDWILRNPLYKGTRQFGDVEEPDAHPALISPEMFDLVNSLIPDRSRRSDTAIEHTYLLQELIHCPHCGGRMTPWYVRHKDDHKRPRNYTAYYECQRGHKNPAQKTCPVKRINAHRLEAALVADLAALELDREVLAEVIKQMEASDGDADAQDRLKQVRAARKALQPKIARLVSAVETGAALASIGQRLAELERQDRELSAEAMLLEAELRDSRRSVPSIDEALANLRAIVEILDAAAEDEKREVLSLLVQRVEAIDKKTVQVTYYVPPALPEGVELGLKLAMKWLPG